MHTFHQDHNRTGYTDQKLNAFKESWQIEFPADIEYISPGKEGHLLLSANNYTALFDIATKKILWENEDYTGDPRPLFVYGDEIMKAGDIGLYTIFNYNTGEAIIKTGYHYGHPTLYENLLIRPGETSLQIVDLDKKHKRLHQIKLMGEISRQGHHVVQNDTLWLFQNEDTSGHQAGQFYLTGIHIDTGLQQLIPVERPLSPIVGYKSEVYFAIDEHIVGIDTTIGEEVFKEHLCTYQYLASNSCKPVIKDHLLYHFTAGDTERGIFVFDLEAKKKLPTLIDMTDQKKYPNNIECMLIMQDELIGMTQHQIILKNVNNGKLQILNYKNTERHIVGMSKNMLPLNGVLYTTAACPKDKSKKIKKGNYNASKLIKIS